MAESLLQRLKFPRKQTEEIVTAVLYHMQFKDVREMRKSTVRRMLMREMFPLELQLHRLDCLGSHRMLDHYEFMLAQARELEQQPEIRPPLLTAMIDGAGREARAAPGRTAGRAARKAIAG